MSVSTLLTVEIPPFVTFMALVLLTLIYVCTGCVIALAFYSWRQSKRQEHVQKVRELPRSTCKCSLIELYKRELANIKIKVENKLKTSCYLSRHDQYYLFHITKEINKNNSNKCNNLHHCNEKRKDDCENNYYTSDNNLKRENLPARVHWNQNGNTQEEQQLKSEVAISPVEHNNKRFGDKITANNTLTNLSVVKDVKYSNNVSKNNKSDDAADIFNWEGTTNVSEFNYNYINETRPFLLPALKTSNVNYKTSPKSASLFSENYRHENDSNNKIVSGLEFTSTAVVTSETNSLSNDELSDHTTVNQKISSSVEENEMMEEEECADWNENNDENDEQCNTEMSTNGHNVTKPCYKSIIITSENKSDAKVIDYCKKQQQQQEQHKYLIENDEKMKSNVTHVLQSASCTSTRATFHEEHFSEVKVQVIEKLQFI